MNLYSAIFLMKLLKLGKSWAGHQPYLKVKHKGEKRVFFSTQLCITEILKYDVIDRTPCAFSRPPDDELDG